MKWLLYCLVAILSLLAPAQAKTLVKVGAYEFPPYVQIQQQQASGLTVELISQLNQLQQQYHFELVLTTAVRRHQDFQQGLFDAIFFEDINWGWHNKGLAMQQSPAFARDDEVFIALLSKAGSQQWFDNLQGKSIAGILGYHYRIANYETDPARLATEYLMIPVTDHFASVELVLKGRTDTAIVTRTFIKQYLSVNPQHHDALLISERIDQSYGMQLLLRESHPLDIATLYQWLHLILQQPGFHQTLAEHGLQLLPTVPPQ